MSNDNRPSDAGVVCRNVNESPLGRFGTIFLGDDCWTANYENYDKITRSECSIGVYGFRRRNEYIILNRIDSGRQKTEKPRRVTTTASGWFRPHGDNTVRTYNGRGDDMPAGKHILVRDFWASRS